MTVNSKLEDYLRALDKTLGPISTSERAEIVTEIKSHVLEAQQRGQKIEDVLKSMGEPEQVANRYLLEHGLTPAKAPRRPIVKWLVIGFLGALGMTLAFALIVIFKFSPMVEVDGAKDHVRLLGGLIDVSDSGGTFSFGRDIKHEGRAKNVQGTLAIDTTKIKNLKMPFKNGKVDLETATDNKLTWSCRIGGILKDQQLLTEKDPDIIFGLDQANAVDCVLQIPSGMTVQITGDNAKVNVQKPRFNLSLQIKNARVEINPIKGEQYKYDINVNNGKVDDFESSTSEKAFKIAVSLENGHVSHD